MLEHGTPLHDLVNKIASERVRLHCGLKECEKVNCENIGMINTAIHDLEKAVDKYATRKCEINKCIAEWLKDTAFCKYICPHRRKW